MWRGRTVLTVHDAAFRRFPETLEARNLRYLEQWIPDSMERADAVIADSRFSAAELGDLFPAARDRIIAVSLGLGPEWRPPPPDFVTSTLDRTAIRRPYVLSVGTLEPRKNHALLKHPACYAYF